MCVVNDVWIVFCVYFDETTGSRCPHFSPTARAHSQLHPARHEATNAFAYGVAARENRSAVVAGRLAAGVTAGQRSQLPASYS